MLAARSMCTVPGCMVVADTVFTPHRLGFIRPKLVFNKTNCNCMRQLNFAVKTLNTCFSFLTHRFPCFLLLRVTSLQAAAFLISFSSNSVVTSEIRYLNSVVVDGLDS